MVARHWTYALDRRSGDVAWSYRDPGRINGWPAAAGDTIVVPVGLAQPAVLLAFRPRA